MEVRTLEHKDIEKDVAEEFNNIKIDLRNLPKFQNYRNSSKPFTYNLTELLRAKLTI